MPVPTTTITTSTILRGQWERCKAYKAIRDDMPGITPLDTFTYNLHDELVSKSAAAFWSLKELSNGAFYLYQDSDKTVIAEITSPKGHSCQLSIEMVGLVATAFAMAQIAHRVHTEAGEVAGVCYQRLMEYIHTLPEAEAIQIIRLLE